MKFELKFRKKMKMFDFTKGRNEIIIFVVFYFVVIRYRNDNLVVFICSSL